jgi:hypothetical protein
MCPTLSKDTYPINLSKANLSETILNGAQYDINTVIDADPEREEMVLVDWSIFGNFNVRDIRGSRLSFVSTGKQLSLK